jgi:hypothetical protein
LPGGTHALGGDINRDVRKLPEKIILPCWLLRERGTDEAKSNEGEGGIFHEQGGEASGDSMRKAIENKCPVSTLDT